MEKDLLLVLEDINKKVNKLYSGNKKDKYNKQIESIINEYKSIEIPEKHVGTYNSLISKGKELLKESNIKNDKKVSYYLRYCGAAVYDFKDNLKPLNLILKSYLLTSVLFFVLAPQYFSFTLPLIFVIPVYIGLRGMRKRVLNGLMIGISIVPMGILVGIVWLKNARFFDAIVSNLSQSYNLSPAFTQNMAIAFIAMSAVLVGSSITLLVSAIKYRKMFV